MPPRPHLDRLTVRLIVLVIACGVVAACLSVRPAAESVDPSPFATTTGAAGSPAAGTPPPSVAGASEQPIETRRPRRPRRETPQVPVPPSSAGPATRSHDPQPTATNGVPADASIDAALARCPTAAEIRVVDRSLWIKFDDHPFTRRLVCRAADGSADLTAFQRHVYQAVLAMRRIPFDEPLPWTGGRSFFRWFTDAVDGITLRTVENSFCCDSGHIVVTTGVFSESPPFDLYHHVWGHEGDDCHSCGLFGLPGLFAHEARHAEGYLHTCGTNDQTFEEMGAWAVHQLYFVWLAEHANSPYMEPSDGPADLYERLADDFSRAYDDNFCSSPR